MNCFWTGVGVGVAGTVLAAFIFGYFARVRDKRHNKWGFDKK